MSGRTRLPPASSRCVAESVAGDTPSRVSRASSRVDDRHVVAEQRVHLRDALGRAGPRALGGGGLAQERDGGGGGVRRGVQNDLKVI